MSYVRKSKNSNSLTWCHCTAGYNKKLFEIVFEKPVYVEIVQSIRQGFDFCLFENYISINSNLEELSMADDKRKLTEKELKRKNDFEK